MKMHSLNLSQEISHNVAALTSFWMEELKVKEVDIEQSIFEQGGNSMQIVYLHSILKDEMDLNVEIADLFIYSTVLSLAEFITGKHM